MKKSDFLFAVLVLIAAMLAVVGFIACGNGSTSGPSVRTGSATVTLSDPPVCKIPNGDLSSVWVTVTRVRANISSSAGENDGGWVDLADLTDNPMQIDLLNIPETTCTSAVLGVATDLPPGDYRQIRLHLLSNIPAAGVAVPATNNCGDAGYNCAVFPGDMKEMLQLSSQDQTGIKIPPGRIAGGAISIEAGQMANVNIDFNACASLIRQGNGQLRLKPTLHAGEVSLDTNSNGISGKVVHGAAGGEGIPGAIVLLEQADVDSIDRVIGSTVTDSGGQFVFCPLTEGEGPYDVIVAASTFDSNAGATTTYNATVTFNVPAGTALGDIPLVPDESATPPSIGGDVTSDALGGITDVSVSPLQSGTPDGGSTIKVTIPVFGATSQPPLLSTSAGSLTYELSVPASNPFVGTYNSTNLPTAYAKEIMTTDVPYRVNAKADSCKPASVTTANTVNAVGAPPVTADTIALTSCTD